jgi:RecB family exonuclease
MARSETVRTESQTRRLVTGDFRALEPALLAEVARVREADLLRPIIILVTSHLLGLHLQRYLPENGLNHINLRFSTIEDFAEEVARPELIARGKTRVPRFAPVEIVRMVCNGLAGKQSGGMNSGFYFGAIAERRGFHEAVLATIDDLKNAGLYPRDLKKALDDEKTGRKATGTTGSRAAGKATGGLRAKKVRDLIKIWDRYEAILAERNWVDDNDVLRLAAELIPRHRMINDALAVIAYGFYDFNELEKRIIHTCAGTKDTALFVPYEPAPAFEYARPTIQWLEMQGFKVEQAEEATADVGAAVPPPTAGPPALARLTSRLFSNARVAEGKAGSGKAAAKDDTVNEHTASNSVAGGGVQSDRVRNEDSGGGGVRSEHVRGEDQVITIISTPGELREVREISRRTLHDALRYETGLWECGILPRAPESYSAIIRGTTCGPGLKPYIADGRPLAGTRAGRSLILLLEILRDDYGRRAVMEFATFAKLKEPFAEAAGPGNRPAAWDVISMEAGIVGGIEDWEQRLNRLLIENREYDESERGWHRTVPGGADAIGSLMSFVKTLACILTPVSKEPTWDGKVSAAEAALRTLVEDDIETERPASKNKRERDDTWIATNWTEEVVSAVRALGGLDDLLDPGDPATEPGLDDFCNTVQDVLDSTALPIGRFQRNGPAVIPLMRARGIPFKTVVLPGMVEKQFPPVARQDAILLDHEREALNCAVASASTGSETGPIPLKSKRRLEEERLLFRLAVGAATERLILTYPRLEMVTARERLPSSFLLATVEALSGERTDFGTLERFEGLTRIPLSRIAAEAPEDALDQVEFDLSRAQGDLKTGTPGTIMHMRDESPTLARALKLEAERWGKRVFTCYDGFLCHKQARKELKDCYSIIEREVSPTRLETYATCPYQYLLGNIMGLRDLVEPERAHELSPLDRGAIVHDILFKFLTQLSGGGKIADGAGETGSKAAAGGKGFEAHGNRPVVIAEKDRALLHRIAREEFNKFARRGITGFPALWALEQERMLEWLDGFLDEEVKGDDWHPAYFEVRYGMKARGPLESHISTEEPVPLPFGKRQVLLRGKIDRVDISNDKKRARVIDYKTGKAYSKDNDLRGGTSLQLPLYLHAVSHLLEPLHKGIEVDHAEYYHLKEQSRSKRHIRFEREALETRRAELENILNTIADHVEAGHFFAVPDGQCKWCDFLSVCGSTRHAIFEMKSGDPSIKEYLSMIGEEDGGAEEEE